jgi:hypothetical protein
MPLSRLGQGGMPELKPVTNDELSPTSQVCFTDSDHLAALYVAEVKTKAVVL